MTAPANGRPIATPIGARSLRWCAVVAAAACGRERSAGASASRFLLVQAAGVEFGITEAQLQAARPNVVWTSSGLVDRVTSRETNAFVFGPFPPGNAGERCATCPLSAVTMISAIPAADTLDYLARVRAIRDRWTALAGAPGDSAVDSAYVGQPVRRHAVTRTERWRVDRDSILLLLRYRIDSGATAEPVRLVHATVYDARVLHQAVPP